jgi:ParB family chromosome partitioning protein
MKINISDIGVGTRMRKLDANKVQTIAESMKQIGLLQPITVARNNNSSYKLIAGLHRLEAAKLLGWQAIEAIEFDGDAIDAELAEIDENLARNDLTVLEQGEHLARRQELVGYKRGGDRRSKRNDYGLKTTKEIAHEIGISENSVEKRIQVARNIVPEVKEVIRNTDIADSTTQLLELARLEPERQVEVAKAIANGIDNVADAKRQIKRDKTIASIKSDNLKENSNIHLVKGDMLELIDTLGKFSLVVTDPPYGVTDYEWDKLDTSAWLDAIIPHLEDEYNLFWFCSPKFAADIEMIFRSKDLPIKSHIVWHRRNMSMGSKANERFIDSWEMILHAGNRALNFPDEWSEAWFDVQTFAVPQTNFADKKLHPTQKPEGLIRRLVEFGSYPGDKILDPFAGSGTTGAVCPDDRDCTLIEREEEYVEIIEGRLGTRRQ